MANPFYNSAPASKPNGMNIMDIYKAITTSKNPMQVFNAMAMNNPKMAPVVNMLNNGFSPQQVFNSLCQQRGINPQEFIKNLPR